MERWAGCGFDKSICSAYKRSPGPFIRFRSPRIYFPSKPIVLPQNTMRISETPRQPELSLGLHIAAG